MQKQNNNTLITTEENMTKTLKTPLSKILNTEHVQTRHVFHAPLTPGLSEKK